eukprot:snap_masked-scaffold_9-processed-gene-6.37-mRNA-1 protein AED:1.00 eAED:1.00 QI:0/0/0/0/1/1/2/0/74
MFSVFQSSSKGKTISSFILKVPHFILCSAQAYLMRCLCLKVVGRWAPVNFSAERQGKPNEHFQLHIAEKPNESI